MRCVVSNLSGGSSFFLGSFFSRSSAMSGFGCFCSTLGSGFGCGLTSGMGSTRGAWTANAGRRRARRGARRAPAPTAPPERGRSARPPRSRSSCRGLYEESDAPDVLPLQLVHHLEHRLVAHVLVCGDHHRLIGALLLPL